MVLHVSNRPTSSVSHNSGATSKKPNALDFPALPASGKSKKHPPRNPIDEDMLPSGVHIPLSNVSAKHRPLVDDYVSVANASSFQKIQTVQKELDAKNRKVAENASAPKLTSQDFPSLSLGSSSKSNHVQANNWAKGQKQYAADKRQRELENRKAKVAPAPLLSKENNNKQSVNATNKKQTQPTATNNKISTNTTETNITKNDKKSKDKKEKTNSDNTNQQQKLNGKYKEKNNNSNNNSWKCGQSSTSPTSSLDNDNESTLQMRPPPGFALSSTNTQPPPGFQSTNVTVNSIAKSPNNLTFTSSFGERYSIVRTHPYIQTTDAVTRNQVKIIKSYYAEE